VIFDLDTLVLELMPFFVQLYCRNDIINKITYNPKKSGAYSGIRKERGKIKLFFLEGGF